jgi:cell division protein FtsL
MSFRSTSDRYNYIFGSTVSKTQEDAYVSSRSKTIKRGGAAYQFGSVAPVPQEAPKEKKKKPKKEQQVQDFDWKYTVIVSVAILVIIACSIYYVKGTVTLHNLSGQLTELKQEKTRLISRQTALETEIDKATNLEEIGKYAQENLGMVYPSKDRTIYYTDDYSDYIRQYESVETGR